MFYDNPKVKYENSPPPADFECDDTPIFFSFKKPRSVKILGSLKIDYNLIHPSLFDIKNEEDSENIIENKINETSQEDAVKDINKIFDKNFEELEQRNKRFNLKTATNKDTTNNNKIYKKQARKETGSSCRVNDKSTDILQKEHVSTGKKKKKHHKRKETKRVKSASDSDDENSINNAIVEVISKSCPKKPKTSVKHSSKHSKSKYSRPVVSDNDLSSYSDKSITSDHYSRKSKKYKSISSDDERNLSHRSETLHKKHPRSPEAKEKVFSGDDENSYLRNPKSLSNKRFSNSDDSNDSASYIIRNREKRYYDDRISECYSPKREDTPDVKLEPNFEDSKKIHGSNYCHICKLSLNSELTWQSHIRGKRHAKAQRAQSVHEVFKSSLLSSTNVSYPEEGNRHDKPPPGMKRVELKGAVSKIQSVCDDFPRNRLIGLGHVWEIRLENGTLNYYCYLCDSACAAGSIGHHLVGYKHRLQCMNNYFPELYEKYKNAHKKEVEIIMEDKFRKAKCFKKEKVRVFRDIPFDHFKKSRSYSCDQPGPSWQVDSCPGTKQKKVVITEENGKSVIPSNQEFLDTKYADFYCTVCDCHMNNIAMWETHIRGRRHTKVMKKTQQGAVITNKYIKAPSMLQMQIEKKCCVGEIVGLDFIRENQGENGNQYNCFLCGGCCSDIDIIDHLRNLKHKTKYLEKMHADGFENSIIEINSIEVSNHYREEMVSDECRNMVLKYGPGNPQVYNLKGD